MVVDCSTAIDLAREKITEDLARELFSYESTLENSEFNELDVNMFEGFNFGCIAEAIKRADEALHNVSPSDLADKFEKCLENLKAGLGELSNHTKHMKECPKELTCSNNNGELVAGQPTSFNEFLDEDTTESLSEEQIVQLMSFANDAVVEAHASLSEINRKDLESLAQLTLNIAHQALPIWESLFSSLANPQRHDRSSRITIEELDNDLTCSHEKRSEPAVVWENLKILYQNVAKHASDHPYYTGCVAALGLPFSGLLVPLGGIIAVALLVERYAPRYTALTWEILANSIQLIRLWLIILRASAKHIGNAAMNKLHDIGRYATNKGILATSTEAAVSCVRIVSLGVSSFLSSTIRASVSFFK